MKARWLAMMLGTGFLGATALGGALVGCSDGGAQHEFDFTKASDRAQWHTEGLAYQGSVGPYAVFKVTAAMQRLVGPSLAVAGGAVALASARNYFVAPKTAAGATRLSVRAGSIVLLDTTQTPMSDGQCTTGTTTTGGGGDLGESGGASADMSGWGDPCKPKDMGGGGGGSGGYGGGGSGGYGGGGGSGGYGGGGGSGGYGGGSGGSGGSYGNPGGLPGGGWNNPGCPTDMGGGGSGGNGGGGSGGTAGGGSGGTGGGGSGGIGGGGSGGTGGGGSGGESGGGSGGTGGGGSGGESGGGSGGTGGGGSGGGGDSDSDLGAPPTPIYIDFPQPAPVGSVILIQHISLGGSATPRDTAPPVCCTGSECTTGGGGSGGSTGSGPIQ